LAKRRYALLNRAPVSAGVASFNARTGVVIPADGDYDAWYYTETEIDAFGYITGVAADEITAGDLASTVVPYIAVDNSDNAWKIPFVNTTAGIAGNFALLMDGGAAPTYNPSTNLFSAVSLAGDFPSQPEMTYGTGGDYTGVSGSSAYGATIWSIDETWKGGAAGDDSLAGNNYGIRWLRSTHTEAHSQVGEGLYGYVAGSNEWGLGNGGIAIFKGNRLSIYNSDDTKVFQAIHDGTDFTMSISTSTGDFNHTGANIYNFDAGVASTSYITGTDISLGGAVADNGVAGQQFFAGVASGVVSMGGYNWDTAAYVATKVWGLPVHLTYNTTTKLLTTANGVTITGEVITTLGNSTDWSTAFGWGDHASGGYLADLVDDGSPELGADLGLNSFDILGAGNVDINGYVTATGAVSGTSIGGITEANLVDKSANEVVTGSWNVISQVLEKGINYTTVLLDAGRTISGLSGTLTITIDANGTVAYPVGTFLGFNNETGNDMTIAITTDTLIWANDGSTGSRTIADGGLAVAQKMTSTTWKIAGSQVT
jgi:hypothetical protein